MGPVPGPDKPLPPLQHPGVVVVTGGFCNLISSVWKLSFFSVLNRKPYREPGDGDVRDLLDPEPTVIGIEPFEEVKLTDATTPLV